MKMKIEIQNCLTWLVNEVAKAVVYNWDNEYKATENKESFNNSWKRNSFPRFRSCVG